MQFWIIISLFFFFMLFVTRLWYKSLKILNTPSAWCHLWTTKDEQINRWQKMVTLTESLISCWLFLRVAGSSILRVDENWFPPNGFRFSTLYGPYDFPEKTLFYLKIKDKRMKIKDKRIKINVLNRYFNCYFFVLETNLTNFVLFRFPNLTLRFGICNGKQNDYVFF